MTKLFSLARSIGARWLGFAFGAILAATTVLLMFPVAANAATTSGPQSTAPSSSLSLSVAPSSASSSSLRLTSQLQGSSSLKGQQVSFFVVTKEFEKTSLDVPIGTATTGSDGSASVTYKPTWTGSQQFVAKLANGSSKSTVTATASYDVLATAPGPLYSTSNPARPLSRVGHFFVGSALTLVAIVWLTLITFLILAKTRLPRLAGGEKTD